jgi:uncharacterized membrane protein YccC
MAPFIYDPDRGRSAVNAVLASFIVILVGLPLHLPHLYWGLVTVLTLTQPRSRTTWEKSVYRLAGTFVAAVVGIWIAMFFPQRPVLQFVVLTAYIAVVTYLATGKTVPYAVLIAGFTCLLVTEDSFSNPDTTIYTGAARFLVIGLGVVATLLVTSGFRRAQPRMVLEERISRIRSLMAELTRMARERLAGGEVLEKDQWALRMELYRLTRELPTFSASVLQDDTVNELSRLTDLQSFIHALEQLVDRLNALHKLPLETMTARAPQEVAEILALMQSSLEEPFGLVISEEEANQPPPWILPLDAFEEKVEEERETQGYYKHTVEENLVYFALAQEIIAAAAATATMRRIRRQHCTTGLISSDPGTPGPRAVLAALWNDLRHPDPLRLHHTAKTVPVVMILLILAQASHLTFVQQGVITAYLMMLSVPVGSSLSKGINRLLGAFAGGIFALFCIVLFTSILGSLAVYLILIGLVMFVSNYINTGNPSYNYIGFQFGFAFVLTMAGQESQPIAIEPAVARFLGIVLGMTVVAIATSSFNPALVSDTLRTMLAAAAAELRGRLAGIRESLREPHAPLQDLLEIRRKLGSLGTLLYEARFESLTDPAIIHRLQDEAQLLRSCSAYVEELIAAARPSQFLSLIPELAERIDLELSKVSGTLQEFEAHQRVVMAGERGVVIPETLAQKLEIPDPAALHKLIEKGRSIPETKTVPLEELTRLSLIVTNVIGLMQLRHRMEKLVREDVPPGLVLARTPIE